MNQIVCTKKCATKITYVARSINSSKPFATVSELRKALDSTAKALQISKWTDWYDVPAKNYKDLFGSQFVKDFRSSPVHLLSAAFPEYDWLPWKFSAVPQYFWDDINNQKKYLEWAGKELKIKEMSDWYNITNEDLIKLKGTNLLGKYSRSIIKLLNAVYPEYEWLPWKFSKCPRGYWDDVNNQRRFMDWVAKQLEIKEKGDWKKVTYKNIIELGGSTLIPRYNMSLIKLLSTVYPEEDWNIDLEPTQRSRNFWSSVNNQRAVMDQVAKELQIKEMSDWYKIMNKDVISHGGVTALQTYNGSLYQLLSTVYPEYEWLPWKFQKVSTKGIETNVKQFMNMVATELNINNLNDWHNVSKESLKKFKGGSILLNSYQNSLYKILSSLYPEHRWLPWQFSSEYLGDLEACKAFIRSAEQELNITKMEDWYKVKAEQLIEMGGGILLVQYHTLFELLSTIYSDFKWEKQFFSYSQDVWSDEHLANYFVQWLKKQSPKEISLVRQIIREKERKEFYPLTLSLQKAFPQHVWITSQNSKKSQYMLKECIEKLFINNKNKDIVLLEECRHPDIASLQLDYFIPQFNIAFEYQGKQHYNNISIFTQKESLEKSMQRDETKSSFCQDKGITLIEVPYWWDRKISSLAATIYNERPDLFKDKPHGEPIPASPSLAAPSTPKISKEYLMTATEWDFDNMEPKGWFMTEKYDGMRLFWDGSQFITRQGTTIFAPQSLIKQMPSVALDGEIWTQYGLFQEAVNLAKNSNEAKWNKVTYWVFDAPQLENKPLEERIEFLQNLSLPSFAKVVEFVKCESKEHLKQFADAIIAKGGEGVMLREPQSLYKRGRSTSLRKYKPFFDTEVKVVEIQYPHGFQCEHANGNVLFVNIKKESLEEAKHVKLGCVISVKHSGTNVHGTLLSPQFYRERKDVNWNEIVNK